MIDRHKLKHLRESNGMVQSELAERAMVSQRIISHYEAGVKQPSVAVLKRLADALGVTMDELMAKDSA